MIALISMLDEERKFYQMLLDKYPEVKLETYLSLNQFKKECPGKHYSGVIIDMFTIVSASMEEKDFFFSLQKGFPLMQIRRSLEGDDINCLVNQKRVEGLKGAEILENFIQNNCKNINPRGVRIYERKRMLLQIHLLFESQENPVPTQLIDISEGGCFVLAPSHEPKQEDRVWITIDDLKEKNPIPCVIKWRKNMEAANSHLIGLGTQFEKLGPELQKEIINILKGNINP